MRLITWLNDSNTKLHAGKSIRHQGLSLVKPGQGYKNFKPSEAPAQRILSGYMRTTSVDRPKGFLVLAIASLGDKVTELTSPPELVDMEECKPNEFQGGQMFNVCIVGKKVLNPEIIKGPWTKEEDDHIMKLVEANGCMKWSVIAKDLFGRIGKQCRERWHNHLDPTIKREAWSKDEESTLTYYHRIHGNKWVEIARHLPGGEIEAEKARVLVHCMSGKNRREISLHTAVV
ncbi:homeodomain-like protein [Tanacetum coccineum]